MQDVNAMPPSGAAKLEAALTELQALSQSGRFQDFWARALDIEGMFMTMKSDVGPRFDRLWNRYDQITTTARREESTRKGAWDANQSRLQGDLRFLGSRHRLPAVQGAPPRYRYDTFWPHAKQVEQAIASASLSQEGRAALTAELEQISAPVRTQQELDKGSSKQNRAAIEAIVADALSRVVAGNPAAVNGARERLRDALTPLRESTLLTEDRDAVWSHWREASGKITLEGQGIRDSAHAAAQERAKKALDTAYNGDPHEALRQVQALQAELGRLNLDRGQREQMRTVLHDAWERSQGRLGEIKIDRDKRRAEMAQRQEEWRGRMAFKLEEWSTRIAEAEEELLQSRQDIGGLEGELAQATSPAYVNTLNKLLRQKRAEITNAEREIEDLKAKSADVRTRLEAPPRGAVPVPQPAGPAPAPTNQEATGT